MIEPGSIPAPAEHAALDAYANGGGAREIVAAALNAMGCEWDDDQGNNSMRRLVGPWVEKPTEAPRVS